MKIRPRRLPVKRNPMARELAQAIFHLRVVPAKKGAGSYSRKAVRQDRELAR